MSRLTAIDPGVKHLGLAVFDDGRLQRAWLEPTADWLKRQWIMLGEDLVIEKPQVYPGSRQKGDPNDLIDLAIVVGRVIGMTDAASITIYKPQTWKGQLPKEVHHARIQKKLKDQGVLSNVELPRAKSLAHNVWDAVGLGLYHLTRKK